MIGIMNVPESPAEFYAAPTRFSPPSSSISSPQLTTLGNPTSRSNSQKRVSSTIFDKRRLSTVDYLKDGRKLFDGKVLENQTTQQLWSRLLMTSVVHTKIEDEIPSPATVSPDQKLFPLPELAECTNSSLSLAAKSGPQSAAANPTTTSKKRAHSADYLRQHRQL